MTKDTIINFEEITNFPLTDFFQKFVDFVSNKKQTLISYYSGDVTIYSEGLFYLLDKLKKDCDDLFDIINTNVYNFLTTDFWELLEQIEDIKIEIYTLLNLSKWLRSSVINSNHSKGFYREDILREGQTFENLMKEHKIIDYNNNWMNIAIKNNLNEEKYNLLGGTLISIPYKNSYNNIQFLNSVVDNLLGDNIYGKDLYKIITLDSIENDLQILEAKLTIVQSAEILINLKRNDVPEFPDDGVNEEVIIGGNLNSLLYPVIFRKIFSLFSKNDTFDSISILNINQEEDKSSIDFDIRTKLDVQILKELEL